MDLCPTMLNIGVLVVSKVALVAKIFQDSIVIPGNVELVSNTV